MEDERDDIAAATRAVTYRFGLGREFRLLPLHLWDDEHVELLASAFTRAGHGLFAITDRRVFFFHAGWWRRRTVDIAHRSISSVEWSSGLFSGRLTVRAGTVGLHVTLYSTVLGKRAADLARTHMCAPVPRPDRHVQPLAEPPAPHPLPPSHLPVGLYGAYDPYAPLPKPDL